MLHAYERASKASFVTEVVVATDDERVVEALIPFGVRTLMTKPDHVSGTDRVAEVAKDWDGEFVVNVQADEPLVDPQTIDAAVVPLIEHAGLSMATVRRRIVDPSEIADPNVVKVVCDMRGRALYFSRWPIPYVRDAREPQAAPPCHWKHLGLYVYRKEFLLHFSKLPQTPLEQLEKLEQLRAIEHGFAIAVVETEHDSIGVDTPEDLERVSVLLKEQSAEGNV